MSVEQMVVAGVAGVMLTFMLVLGLAAFFSRDIK
jgi:hypothetical protein